MTAPTPAQRRAAALATADKHDAQARQWADDVARSQDELARLQTTAAQSALDDPDSVSATTARMSELRDRITIGQEAAKEAARLADSARSEAMHAEADELQPAIDAAQARLDEHNARTVELLDQLREHTREQWWPGDLTVEPAQQHLFSPGHDVNDPERLGVQRWSSVRDDLAGERDRLVTQQRHLHARADGADPLAFDPFRDSLQTAAAFDAVAASAAAALTG